MVTSDWKLRGENQKENSIFNLALMLNYRWSQDELAYQINIVTFKLVARIINKIILFCFLFFYLLIQVLSLGPLSMNAPASFIFAGLPNIFFLKQLAIPLFLMMGKYI